MIKNDKSTLEEISFRLNERDIANFAKTLEYLKYSESSTLSNKELSKDLETLKKITQLKLNQSFYAFHCNDSWAEQESGKGSGINLYCRQGDSLDGILTSHGGDEVPEEKEIMKYLSNNSISKIYTGPIPLFGKALDIDSVMEDENDGHTIGENELHDSEIKYFKSEGIEVISLDALL